MNKEKLASAGCGMFFRHPDGTTVNAQQLAWVHPTSLALIQPPDTIEALQSVRESPAQPFVAVD